MRFASLAVLLVACGGGGGSTDVKKTLVFADRSDTEILRLINAAGGTDMFGAENTADQFAGSTDPCPAISVDGQTVTLTGGCTTADGMTVGGTAHVTNSFAWDQIEPDFTSDTVYELEQFSVGNGTFTQTFDGVFRIQDNHTVYDADVTVTQLDVTVRSDLHYECSQSDLTCELSGSGLELVGVGGALVSGSVKSGNGASASFTLRGVDTLKVTLTNGCTAWQIEGSDRGHTCP